MVGSLICLEKSRLSGRDVPSLFFVWHSEFNQSPDSCNSGHLTARIGTAPADFCALLHHLIVAKALTILSAPLADLCTDTARLTVKI
jgi:hypothetical protein